MQKRCPYNLPHACVQGKCMAWMPSKKSTVFEAQMDRPPPLGVKREVVEASVYSGYARVVYIYPAYCMRLNAEVNKE